MLMITRKLSQEPICCIYSITNTLNNKVYIGQSIDVERRWEQHKYGKGNIIVRNAIKKYGIDNFKFDILEIVETNSKTKEDIIKELTDLEQKWFDLRKPFLKENGYNIRKTSSPNLTPNRDKNFGEKIRRIKIDNNHTGKPLIQYDIDGNFIKKWKSAAEIERVLGYKAENISACCLGKNNSSHGFIWKFDNYNLQHRDIILANESLRLSEVKQYNLKGELLNTFKNVKYAALLTGFKESLIRHACNGSRKTSCGFIWKFKNQKLNLLDHINKKDFPIRQINCVTNEVHKWDNVYEAINKNSLSKYAAKNIYNVCEGKLNYYLGCKWEWENINN